MPTITGGNPPAQPFYLRAIPLTGAIALIAASLTLNTLSALDRGGTHWQQAAWVATAIGADLLKASCPLVAFAAIGHGAGLVQRASAVLLLVIALSFSTVNALSYAHGGRAADAAANTRVTDAGSTLASDRVRLEDKAKNAKSRQERDEAEAKLAKLRTEAKALPSKHTDPAAVALSEYADSAGIKVSPASITAWLSALPVLLLEIGSTLALLVARSAQSRNCAAPANSSLAPVSTPVEAEASRILQPQPKPERPTTVEIRAPKPAASPESTADSKRQSIIDRLRQGAIEGRRQVDVASAAGIPITTLRRMLADEFGIRMVRTPSGSRLELRPV